MPERAKESVAQVRGLFEIAVVCRLFACVVPHAFSGIEFGPVGRQLEDLQITALGGEPLIGFLLFVIGNVVLDQEDPVSSPIKRRQEHLLQKSHIGFGTEVLFLVPVNKLRVVQPHRPKNLLRVAFPFGGDLRSAPQPRPGGM